MYVSVGGIEVGGRNVIWWSCGFVVVVGWGRVGRSYGVVVEGCGWWIESGCSYYVVVFLILMWSK